MTSWLHCSVFMLHVRWIMQIMSRRWWHWARVSAAASEKPPAGWCVAAKGRWVCSQQRYRSLVQMWRYEGMLWLGTWLQVGLGLAFNHWLLRCWGFSPCRIRAWSMSLDLLIPIPLEGTFCWCCSGVQNDLWGVVIPAQWNSWMLVNLWWTEIWIANHESYWKLQTRIVVSSCFLWQMWGSHQTYPEGWQDPFQIIQSLVGVFRCASPAAKFSDGYAVLKIAGCGIPLLLEEDSASPIELYMYYTSIK